MTDIAPEYVQARRVLLDALDALHAQRPSLILVGAQAVYTHTGALEGTGIQMTTDSDLAIDVDLLANDPEMTQALKDAEFFPVPQQPGQWTSPVGIRVDLMTVPHQSQLPHGRRAANLFPHGAELARLTPGLEAALVDNAITPIASFEAHDDRVIELRVAGPAALLTAKLIKLKERYREFEAGGGKKTRLKEKDALDCYRILRIIQTKDLQAGFETHRASEEALAVSRSALSFFEQQHRRGEAGLLHMMRTQALPGDLTALASFDALSGDLLEALASDLVMAD